MHVVDTGHQPIDASVECPNHHRHGLVTRVVGLRSPKQPHQPLFELAQAPRDVSGQLHAPILESSIECPTAIVVGGRIGGRIGGTMIDSRIGTMQPSATSAGSAAQKSRFGMT